MTAFPRWRIDQILLGVVILVIVGILQLLGWLP